MAERSLPVTLPPTSMVNTKRNSEPRLPARDKTFFYEDMLKKMKTTNSGKRGDEGA